MMKSQPQLLGGFASDKHPKLPDILRGGIRRQGNNHYRTDAFAIDFPHVYLASPLARVRFMTCSG